MRTLNRVQNCGFAVVIFLALLLTPSAYGTSLLQDLLVDYHKYGLPLPSANAKLVYVTSSGKTNLAFIQKGTNDSIFLSGTSYRKFAEPATIKDIDQADVKLEDTDFRAVVTVGNQGLCFAIQCEAIGLHSLATLVLDRALSSRFDYTFLGNMLEPGGLKPVLDEGLSPKERLWCSAWHFWLHELGKPESDRAAILGRMQSMLQSERGITSGEAATLVDCLRKTLLPNNAQPGTIDDFINQLTEVTFLGVSESTESGSEFRYHPMVLRIVEMGFDAVPSLIEHLDDDRLTRELGPKACGGWCPPFIYPIGFCMEWILRDLAGEDAAKVWDGAQDKEEERRLIRQWWNNAKLIGEEAYFLKSVVGSGTNVTDASYAIVDVLAKKYPQQLPGIYTRMLKDSRNIDADRVARAIAISSIPKQQKVESLVAGTRHHNVDHRALARELLKKVAPSRFED